MQKQPIFLGLLILAQVASILFFMTDVVTDAQSLGRFWYLDQHFRVELIAALLLTAAVAIETRYLSHLVAHARRMEKQLSTAAMAFHDVVDAHFTEWGLTASEKDVAHFMVKGCSIAEISHLRGTAEGTVKSHMNAIYRKAGVTNRGELLSLLIEDLMQAERP
ncbi:helix-turn-helix transcriptional regulator [Rhodobacterales bacterium FZCC0069]|jgi:DNA-binding NarL/FixJ family response regulator|nr:helix-turn-helix transcriptional regulator [Rhodobacterales bacterium FZCC0069]